MMRHHHSLTALILVLGGVMISARAITPADIAAIPRQELVDSLYVVCGKTLLVNLAKARTPGTASPASRPRG